MQRRFRIVLAGIAVLLAALVIGAQEPIEPITVPDTDASIAITFPPPVYVLNDIVQIIGTADEIDMSSYFIEYRPLLFGEEAIQETSADRPWLPASLPANRVVRGGVIGVWNTTTVRDGLYEIRLTINRNNSEPVYFRVSPLRVENDPTDDIGGLPPVRPTLMATPTQLGGQVRPPLQATPTQLGSGTPIVRALTDSNVREGDDTSYARIGALLTGETAPVLGISSFGSGWYYIQMANGRRGFIAPSVVEFSGNLASLERIAPPPPPTPPATATPLTSANLQVTGMRLAPAQPTCAQSFDLFINVQNTGSGATAASGILTVTDRNVRTGIVAGTTTGGFPAIQPGASFVVVVTLTVDTFYNEDHDIIIQLDTRGEIPETNEGDNTASIRYQLQQGTCN
jgi:hypothetical protein